MHSQAGRVAFSENFEVLVSGSADCGPMARRGADQDRTFYEILTLSPQAPDTSGLSTMAQSMSITWLLEP